ncbi:MAG: STAS domain-containing protein [Chloroflexi bacterium]|nr:STAS domain-containing protein [Chloroflexota bacterium]
MNDNMITVLTPRGRLDADGSRPFQTELQDHIANGRVHLLVDLQETRYISSNGLRVLLAAQKQAQKQGGAIKLCALSPRLVEIFEMAGFDRVFEIFATREDAQRAMNQ